MMVEHETQSDRPELLAPAGDWEALRAAVANGADAVYFGLSNFNARHRATNFTLEELPQVMACLHEHNVKGYVTFNTLIFSDELEQAVQFAVAIAQAGADAVIVQDLGLARLLHRMAPDLPLHGSTQMTLTEPRGIELVRQLGIQRVILARELAIHDIQRIAGATAVPVEVFVHGALCVSYSGQCLTSESLGGRSANRGQCAQACRLPYDLIVDGAHRDLGEKAYLLSPQDLAAYDRIEDLLKLGVRAFKIEGRLKSAHYVAATTQAYRAALDAALAGRRLDIAPQQKMDLEQSFSRGFTHGFLDGVNHQKLVPARFPKSRGIYIGTVTGRTPRGVMIELESPAVTLKNGDGVVFDEGHPEQDEQGGRVFEVHSVGTRPARIEVIFGRGDVNLAAVEVGSMVWKTDDPAMRRRLEQSYRREKVVHRVPLSVRVFATIGQPLRVQVADDTGQQVTVQWGQPLQAARKHPLTPELVREQFGRLGDTPFEFGAMELNGNEPGTPADPVMVPKSVLNDLRRQAVEQLMLGRDTRTRCTLADPNGLEALREQARRGPSPRPLPGTPGRGEVKEEPSCGAVGRGELLVLARTLEQLRAVLEWRPGESPGRPAMVYCDFEDIRRYTEAVAMARSAGMPVALATLRIAKPSEEGLLRQIADCRPDAVLVRTLASLAFLREQAPRLPLIGDYALNVANELTAGWLAEQGLVRLVPSYDLNWEQIGAMLKRMAPGFFEAVIHQHMPMFHMEHCVFAATLSNGKDHHDCGRPCERHRVDLRDRVGLSHPLVADVGCRNTVFNGSAQSTAEFVPRMKELGVRYYRVELLREDRPQTHVLLNHYARALA